MIVLSKKLDKLMKELKKNNSETFFHMLRTKKYVNDFVYELNKKGYTSFGDFEIDCICKGAMLHDIGKLNIDNYILTKDSRLDVEEKAEMKTHAEYSYNLVKNELTEEEFSIVSDICRYHHERIDGSGYNKLSDIPLYVQIVALCDAFDALYNDRIYRNGLPREKALQLIKDGKCGGFQEKLVTFFEEFINNLLD